jgi:radical SAM protein with 4Fe4S-binding SPASM domain
VEDVFATLSKTGSSTIIFGGGEPTLDKSLGEYIDKATNEYGHITGIATNGIALSDDLLETAKKNHTFIQFSLDTTDREHYRYLCGVDKLNDVIRNIERCQENEITYSLSCVISETNFPDLEQLLEFTLHHNIPFIHVGHLISTGRASCHKSLKNVSLLDLWHVLFPIQLENYKYIGIDLVEDFILHFNSGEKHGYCASLEGKGMEILNNGEVQACGLIFEEELKYGCLGKETFSEIYNRWLAKKDPCFDYGKLQQCNQCEANTICGFGGCRALAYILEGSSYGKYPFCEDTKKVYNEILEHYESGALDEYLKFIKDLPIQLDDSSRKHSSRIF